MTAISSITEPQINYDKIYSQSKIKLYTQCPKAYYFSYIDEIMRKLKYKYKKLPQYIWGFQTVGKAVHDAITLFYYLDDAEKTAKKLSEQLKRTWKSEAMWNKKMPLGKWGGFSSEDEERQCYKDAILMLNNFLKLKLWGGKIKFKFLPTNDLKHSIEDYKKLITPITDDYDISGKFDLLYISEDSSLNIVDFKTSKREDLDSFQLRFYKLLAEKNFKEKVTSISYFYLRSGRKQTAQCDDFTNDDIKTEIIKKIEVIKKDTTFEAIPSKLCKYCVFQMDCPKKLQVKEIIKTVTEDELTDDLPF